MWIQVRSMDGRKSVRIDGLSKLTKIEEIREKLVDDFEAPVERQKLFYRGKLMLNGYSLFDYDVTLNALIQLMVVPEKPVDKQLEDIENKKEEEISVKEEVCTADNDLSIHAESTYKLGDIIDCLDEEMGAWFEARLVKITRNTDDVSGKKLACNSSDAAETVSMETDNKDDTSDEGENKENVTLDANMNQSMTKTCGILTDSKNNCTDIKERITDNNRDTPSRDIEDDGFVYHVIFESYEDDSVVKVPVKNIRPRARHKLSLSEVQIGDRVMVNYNYDEPKCRGYWYDAVITGKRNTRTIKELTATVYIGKELVPFENCKIQFVNEVFKIEEPGTQLNINDASSSVVSPEKRLNKPECDHCLDNPAKKCKFCACTVCGDKKDPEKQVLCDECDQAYHLYCLKPPLTEIPDVDEWYCPECKTDTSEVVQAGEKLKGSKKKARMASAKSEKTRDWGKGMACVGRSKQCNIVPPNHFGPIPGIHVGQMWKYRVQVSEAGVHRPHVAGISGRENEGAYSIVLAGGYEDDVDNGDEFTYTGSGGRDLSGNKRTAEQSCDQTLTRMNKALARDCYAPLDNKNGAESKEWKKGKPIRVVRNCKGAKHSKYAPTEGNRYDGIYKVVKYWPDKGLSGYIVWRYLLRRDDPDPAPWTKEGKKRTEELGLVMEYPDGYMEKEAEKQSEKEKKEQEKVEKTPAKKKKGVKRKRVINSDSEEDSESPVRKKSVKYSIPNEVKKHIKGDVKNAKLWEEAMESVGDGVQKFLAKVEELFQCICCQELVFQPITTDCNHNICKPCLQRAFKAEVYSCPTCRAELGKNYSMNVNQSLATALNGLYPGYETGR